MSVFEPQQDHRENVNKLHYGLQVIGAQCISSGIQIQTVFRSNQESWPLALGCAVVWEDTTGKTLPG